MARSSRKPDSNKPDSGIADSSNSDSNTSVSVDVEGRTLQLSSLDKVLFPAAGFTKSQVIDYYARIAPVLVPHVTNRCMTVRRFPDGVDGDAFYSKRCPDYRPDWVATARGPGDKEIDFCRIDEAATLVWMANLAALELHAPMARADDLENPTMLVFDLDPGEPASIIECCQVALYLREVLESVNLVGFAKTSGSKGLQIYVPLNEQHRHDHASSFALACGQLLTKQHPTEVLVTMAKAERTGKVFVDWSQNSRHKTTAAVYSLRAKQTPTVSTPVTWDEVAEGAQGRVLSFLTDEVLDRVDQMGDLFAPTLTLRQDLPTSRQQEGDS